MARMVAEVDKVPVKAPQAEAFLMAAIRRMAAVDCSTSTVARIPCRNHTPDLSTLWLYLDRLIETDQRNLLRTRVKWWSIKEVLIVV
jgi:hypothetical protein